MYSFITDIVLVNRDRQLETMNIYPKKQHVSPGKSLATKSPWFQPKNFKVTDVGHLYDVWVKKEEDNILCAAILVLEKLNF